MRTLLAVLMLLVSSVALAQKPIPGYVITVQGMTAGNPNNGGHPFGYKAYNGFWCQHQDCFRTDKVTGEITYFFDGTIVKYGGGIGCGNGMGDERMSLRIDKATGKQTVTRTTGFGLIGTWTGTGNLTLTAQGKACDCSAATVTVTQVADITPYLP